MIGKTDWFKPRLTGWGLAPKTWEGWLYIIIFVLLFLAGLNLPLNPTSRVFAASLILVIFIVDSLFIMFQVYHRISQEEKRRHHLIDAAVAYVAVVALIMLFAWRFLNQGVIDEGLLIVMVVMAATKFSAGLVLR